MDSHTCQETRLNCNAPPATSIIWDFQFCSNQMPNNLSFIVVTSFYSFPVCALLLVFNLCPNFITNWCCWSRLMHCNVKLALLLLREDTTSLSVSSVYIYGIQELIYFGDLKLFYETHNQTFSQQTSFCYWLILHVITHTAYLSDLTLWDFLYLEICSFRIWTC